MAFLRLLQINAPVIIQFSNGGRNLMLEGTLLMKSSNRLGGIAGAKHIHTLAEAYGATVILHTDHCAKSLI
jgi:fructose-bisphosphate aldolase class II